jgi:hypothetical protein
MRNLQRHLVINDLSLEHVVRQPGQSGDDRIQCTLGIFAPDARLPHLYNAPRQIVAEALNGQLDDPVG